MFDDIPGFLDGTGPTTTVLDPDGTPNNILDADAAWELACDLAQPGARPCVIIKHGNPCGAAWGLDSAASFSLAKAADAISAFGGIVALPGELDESAADVYGRAQVSFDRECIESYGGPHGVDN